MLTRAGIAAGAEEADGGVSEEQPSNDITIVPLVDFANCAEVPSAECRRGPSGEVLLVALQDLRAGDEVTLRYGDQSHEQCLFTFGFALPSTKCVVSAPLPLTTLEGASNLRAALMQLLVISVLESDGSSGSDGGVPPAARLFRTPSGEVDCSELIMVANILHMDEEKVKAVAEVASRSNGILPAELGERPLGAAPAAHLEGLLEVWLDALGGPPPAGGAATSKAGRDELAPLRAYRAECRALVAAALARVSAP